MVIATSGEGSSINYNRIISSASSNSIDFSESKTFRDTALQTTKRLRGLFIVDKDNLVALIWDSSTRMTNVATFNLTTLSVTYKESLPIIYDMYTCVFVSASVYYTTSWNANFYQDYSNSVTLNSGRSHGIVYSSDMYSSSCYTM
jgi:hypothetical protein